MIVFAFPAIIAGTALLELERAFDWPFFIAERGGDPLLWQHLFWFFGHPEVYIIFLPAAGLVSMMVPALARHAAGRPPRGRRRRWSAIGVLSFALWAHHMFTAGLGAAGDDAGLGRQHGGRDAERRSRCSPGSPRCWRGRVRCDRADAVPARLPRSSSCSAA